MNFFAKLLIAAVIAIFIFGMCHDFIKKLFGEEREDQFDKFFVTIFSILFGIGLFSLCFAVF